MQEAICNGAQHAVDDTVRQPSLKPQSPMRASMACSFFSCFQVSRNPAASSSVHQHRSISLADCPVEGHVAGHAEMANDSHQATNLQGPLAAPGQSAPVLSCTDAASNPMPSASAHVSLVNTPATNESNGTLEASKDGNRCTHVAYTYGSATDSQTPKAPLSRQLTGGSGNQHRPLHRLDAAAVAAEATKQDVELQQQDQAAGNSSRLGPGTSLPPSSSSVSSGLRYCSLADTGESEVEQADSHSSKGQDLMSVGMEAPGDKVHAMVHITPAATPAQDVMTYLKPAPLYGQPQHTSTDDALPAAPNSQQSAGRNQPARQPSFYNKALVSWQQLLGPGGAQNQGPLGTGQSVVPPAHLVLGSSHTSPGGSVKEAGSAGTQVPAATLWPPPACEGPPAGAAPVRLPPQGLLEDMRSKRELFAEAKAKALAAANPGAAAAAASRASGNCAAWMIKYQNSVKASKEQQEQRAQQGKAARGLSDKLPTLQAQGRLPGSDDLCSACEPAKPASEPSLYSAGRTSRAKRSLQLNSTQLQEAVQAMFNSAKQGVPEAGASSSKAAAAAAHLPPLAFDTLDLDALNEDLFGLVLIGKGGGGAVFKAVWQGAQVAVKFMLSNTVATASLGALEAVVAASVNHPNVVQTYAFDVTKVKESPMDRLDQQHQASMGVAAGVTAYSSHAIASIMTELTREQQRLHQFKRQWSASVMQPSVKGQEAADPPSDETPSVHTPEAEQQEDQVETDEIGQALTEAFNSDDGFGEPVDVVPGSWNITQVLTSMQVKLGMYVTHIIMEYCDRGTLLDALQRGVFSLGGTSGDVKRFNERVVLRASLRTARDIARGMHHLHTSDIIHGDLKPGNVLLKGSRTDRRGFVAKVADFGLSKVVQGSKPVEMHHWSTITHMAPEVIQGTWVKQSDVYSFGVLLWQLMCGEPEPYKACTAPQVLAGVAQGWLKLQWPRHCHPAVAKLGVACMSSDPALRPTFQEITQVLVQVEQNVRSELKLLWQCSNSNMMSAASQNTQVTTADVEEAGGRGRRTSGGPPPPAAAEQAQLR